VMVLGNLRWLLAPDNEDLFALVYVLSSAVALYKLLLSRTYGRGPKL
jgi:phage portal protein BeeE